jgi:protease PrsW
LLIKGLPPLVVILWLVRRAHDREAAFYVGHLARLRDPQLITEGELAVLASGSRRAAARWSVGRRGYLTVRRLQRAQARLAVELSRASYEVSDGSVDRRAEEVREQREALVALGHREATAAPRTWRQTASTAATTVVAIAVLWVALASLGGA